MTMVYKLVELLFCLSVTLALLLPSTSNWKDEAVVACAGLGLLVVIVLLKTKKLHLFETFHFGWKEVGHHDLDDE